jgi:hypothetical protein
MRRRVKASPPTPFREQEPTMTPNRACDHLHDTTTRYDHVRKRLTFLLVCADCGTESVVETLSYEPRFESSPRRP